MITREELLKSPEYWFENAQNDLYGHVIEYMEKEGINQTQLAEKLGVSKGYISQILKGEFNYTLKKLIELGLAIGQVPKIEYSSIDKVIEEDCKSQYFQLQPFSVPFTNLNSNSSRFPDFVVSKPSMIDSDHGVNIKFA